VPASEMKKGHVGDGQFPAEDLPSDLPSAPPLFMEGSYLLSSFLQVCDLFLEILLRIFSHRAASRKKSTQIQGCELLQRLQDFVDIVVDSKRPILATDVGISGEEPAFLLFIETDVVRAMSRRVKDLKTVMLRFDERSHRFGYARLRPTPENPAVRLKTETFRVRENGKSVLVCQDSTASLSLKARVPCGVILVGVCVHHAVQG